MNKYQKLIQERFLDNEEAVINALKSTYETSYKDITKKVKSLDLSIERLQKAYDDIEGDEIGELAQAFLSKNRKYTPEEAKETLQSMLQSKVYQRDYQKALEKQVDGVLGKMLDKEYKTISDYLTECYEDSFIGTMFDMQSQGIPLCFPLDQEAIVNAVQLDSPIKEGLYNHLGENVGDLKKKIASEVSRGISTGMSFEKIARNISLNMMGTYENPGGSYAYALRIARTEGHRIQCQGTMDACFKAKEKGADVVKQWDSTLDGNTRESHQQVDGEIRELDKKFSNGLMFPGDPSGGAAEVVNCRCALLQRARWALDEAELETLKERAEYFGLDKSENFEDFKKKYLKAADKESEIVEIKDAIDFEYGNYTRDDYNKWWDDYEDHNSGIDLSAEELKVIEDYTEGSFISMNAVSRGTEGKLNLSADDLARARKNADVLEGALSKYDLDTDIVTHRFERDVSWLTGGGNGVDELEALVGKEYTAKGFTSSGMLGNRFRFTGGKKDAVHFEIVTPKGTNGAFLSMSKKGENEFLYNRNTRFKILDGGERVVKERKFNLRTGQFDDVDVTERFLKVQVIPEKTKALTNPVKSFTINLSKNHDDLEKALSIKKIAVDKSVKALDFESVKEGMQGIEKVLQEFPQAQSMLHKISTKKSGIMCAEFKGTINFNPTIFDTRSNALKAHPATPLYIKGNGIIASGAHETGHILEAALINKDANIAFKGLAWTDCTKAKEVVSEACKAAKKTAEGKGKLNAALKGEISGYARTDASECMAEAVSDYVVNGSDSAVLSKEIWKILKRELG